jgi:predicted ATPase
MRYAGWLCIGSSSVVLVIMTSFSELDITVSLEHVRSFATLKNVPLRPLTLLVGENSSGKTTFLATIAALWPSDYRYPFNPNFNQAPYNLGTFETIVTRKQKRNGQADTFRIGYSVVESSTKRFSIEAEYINRHGAPGLRSFSISNAKVDIRVTLGEKNSEVEFSTIDGLVKNLRFTLDRLSAHSVTTEMLGYSGISGLLFDSIASQKSLQKLKPYLPRKLSLDSPFFGTVSVAPLRSRPERTYDVLQESFHVEGEEIPAILTRLLEREPQSPDAKSVSEALARFGEDSGMFTRIEVRRLGRSEFDPIQLHVHANGQVSNLVDVGYGISQVLPVLVRSCLSYRANSILIQQPEVHLHPRAQAALGSFFVDMVGQSKGGKMMLIETHSDYLLDRVRQDVADGRIRANDVQILFFDKPKHETTIHPIALDELGNVVDPPPAYRSFFLEEQERLLSRGA